MRKVDERWILYDGQDLVRTVEQLNISPYWPKVLVTADMTNKNRDESLKPLLKPVFPVDFSLQIHPDHGFKIA